MANLARLFVAVPVPDEVRAALASHLMHATGDRPLPGKPVAPANWHFTMRFLGPTDEVACERLLAALVEAELGEPFSISLGGLGAFPRLVRATVLWLAIDDGTEHMANLAALAEEASQQAGFAPEERPFHPHLTLSRIRPHQDVQSLIERVPPLRMSLPVDRLVVYQSHLGRGGARYEELESLPLQGS